MFVCFKKPPFLPSRVYPPSTFLSSPSILEINVQSSSKCNSTSTPSPATSILTSYELLPSLLGTHIHKSRLSFPQKEAEDCVRLHKICTHGRELAQHSLSSCLLRLFTTSPDASSRSLEEQTKHLSMRVAVPGRSASVES